VVSARSPGEVLPALRELEDLVERRGLHAAGWIAYEAAPAFDPALRAHPPGDFPLVWFGLYDAPRREEQLPPGEEEGYELGGWAPSVSRAAYDEAIAAVKGHIARGETYQVNYTFRLSAPFAGSAWGLFREMAAAQETGYAAYLDTGAHVVASASPELFFRLDGERITCRPMKGTVKRGRTTAEDRAQAAWLAASEKNRAENVMIVDMIRNDLGRIAAVGSVRVPALYTPERYPTLWQLTSTVVAETGAPLSGILAALFPCASITGAPKVSTTRIIAALEGLPRRVYTGSIGFVAPGRRAQFSVAIRTVLVDRAAGRAEYGVGGGIVWDSTSAGEYDEALLKARVLTARRPRFSLLETLRWAPGEGYALRELHVARLLDSADYFDIRVARDGVEAFLDELAGTFPAEPRRVRALLDAAGVLSAESAPLAPAPRVVRVALAAAPVDSGDVFLYHKTTRRELYERARAARPGCDDVLLHNERGELTESTIANLVVELDGDLWTPPVSCGLLPGTFRAHLLAAGKVKERVIPLKRLHDCTKIHLVNSVRGWMTAALTETC
jgi:para-aminobenzoate synthetase/4-amino-4-deoxychorismate lyase